MSHVEMQLLSRVIRSGELSQVIEWGIQEDDFRTSEGRGLFVHLLGYWKAAETSGSVPGPMSFTSQYPTFQFCDDDSMTTDALCAEVRSNRMKLEAREFLMEANEMLELSPATAVSTLAGRMMALQSLGMRSRDELYSTAIENQVQRYSLAQRGIQTCKFRWPWEPFNEATGGVQEDDYIVIYGRPKSKKTFVLGEFIASVYDQGKRAIVYTKEMPTWQIYRRITAACARLPYAEYIKGKLNQTDYERFIDVANNIKESAEATGLVHNIVAISGRDAPAGQDSMTWLRGKIDKYRPDAVFIDGLYLMSSDTRKGKDHERVMAISRAARQTVLDTGIPIVATMQANRSASKGVDADLDEIAYSDAIGQDATVAIRSINLKTESPPTIALVIPGSREWELDGIKIGGLPYTDLSFKSIMSNKEVAKATEGDSDEADGKEKKGSSKNGEVKPIRKPVNNGLDASATNALIKDQLKNASS